MSRVEIPVELVHIDYIILGISIVSKRSKLANYILLPHIYNFMAHIKLQPMH